MQLQITRNYLRGCPGHWGRLPMATRPHQAGRLRSHLPLSIAVAVLFQPKS